MPMFKGVKVKITPSCDYPTPYGLEYNAKGCYVNKKQMIVVGHLERGNTIRISYPINDVTIQVIE
jgi:hypothetical protein